MANYGVVTVRTETWQSSKHIVHVTVDGEEIATREQTADDEESALDVVEAHYRHLIALGAAEAAWGGGTVTLRCGKSKRSVS